MKMAQHHAPADPPCTCYLCRAYFARWPQRMTRSQQWERRRIGSTRDDGTRKRWTEAQKAEYRHRMAERFNLA